MSTKNDMERLLAQSKKSFSKTQKNIEEAENNTQDFSDSRFWKYTPDDKGNANIVMRFLPLWDGADDEVDSPIVTVSHHYFKVGTKKFWAECPNTKNDKVVEGDCPVCDWVKKYRDFHGGWKEMTEKQQNLTRGTGTIGRGRRYQHIANVLILKDKANPENEGKVFLWKFGNAINNMIQAAIVPKHEDIEPIDPFCPLEGHNFHLRVSKDAEGRTQYDDSSFAPTATKLAETQEGIIDIWKQAIDLNEFINIDYKSYEELEKKAKAVMGPSYFVGEEQIFSPSQDEPPAGKVDDEDDMPSEDQQAPSATEFQPADSTEEDDNFFDNADW